MSANISILTKLQMFFLKFLNIFLGNQKKTSHFESKRRKIVKFFYSINGINNVKLKVFITRHNYVNNLLLTILLRISFKYRI